MMRLASLVLVALLGLSGRVALATDSSGTAGESPVVYCYDEPRDSVSRELAGNCKGRMVSAAEADAIAARHREHMREALYDRPPPLFPDLRLFGIGTGFFITPDGKLLTNHHVVAACAGITVEQAAGGVVRGTILAADEARDLALLQAGGPAPATAKFGSTRPPGVGQLLVTVGYPNQGLAPVRPLITEGTAVGLGPRGEADSHYVISADVRHGNSGGPVLDQSGHVIGVVQAKVDTVKVYQKTKQLVDNIGIAIANQVVVSFLQQNHVVFQRAAANRAMTPEQLFEMAKPFIARIGCWNHR